MIEIVLLYRVLKPCTCACVLNSWCTDVCRKFYESILPPASFYTTTPLRTSYYQPAHEICRAGDRIDC